MLDALRFNIFDHIPHILRTTISAQFFDFLTGLAFCPGLIFLEGVKDSIGVFVRENEGSIMICIVVCEIEDVLSPPSDMTFVSHKSECTSSRGFPRHLVHGGNFFRCCLL